MSEDAPWMRDALCRGEVPDFFFDHDKAVSAAAVTYCGPCPVRRDCGGQAVWLEETDGVWAGYRMWIEKERRACANEFPPIPIVNRVRPSEVSELIPCGSQAAYRRHLRNEEEPCDPCNEANILATNVRRDYGGHRFGRGYNGRNP